MMYHRDPRCELSILTHVSALLSDDPITSQCAMMWVLVFFTHVMCHVSFIYDQRDGNLEPRARPISDKCTKMLNSRWGSRKIRNPPNFTFYLLFTSISIDA
jgi:hypothetical protein